MSRPSSGTGRAGEAVVLAEDGSSAGRLLGGAADEAVAASATPAELVEVAVGDADAVAAGLACGAEAVIIPEDPMSLAEIEKQLAKTQARGKRHSFLIVAEGAGDARELASAVASRTGQEAKWVVLGHTQRGGPPTARDRIAASLLASRAVELLADETSNVMVGFNQGAPAVVPLSKTAAVRENPFLSWRELTEILAR